MVNVLMGYVTFQSPKQPWQSIEDSSEHWSQPGKSYQLALSFLCPPSDCRRNWRALLHLHWLFHAINL